MKYSILRFGDLTVAMLDRWREIQRRSETMESPFFSPEFTRIVARHRVDVEIAVIEDANGIVAFFPFQRGKHNHGHPVGWRINDYQGLITEPQTEIDPSNLLRECRLRSWRFDHVFASSSIANSFCAERHESPVIKIDGGYDAYLEEKRKTGKSRIKSILRNMRKIEKDFGPLQFQFDSNDDGVFKTTMKWKSNQLVAMGVNNAFEQPWAQKTALDVSRAESPDFMGVVTSLYAADKLVAAHVGIRNENVLHWWVPTYNPDFGKYSPGGLLLLKALESCSEQGIGLLDLGKGQEPYKKVFKTGGNQLCEGTLTSSLWNKKMFQLKDYVRSSTFAQSAKSKIIRAKRILRGTATPFDHKTD